MPKPELKSVSNFVTGKVFQVLIPAASALPTNCYTTAGVAPAQGIGINQRIGDVIMVKKLEIRLSVAFGSQNNSALYRVIVFSRGGPVALTGALSDFFKFTAIGNAVTNQLVNREAGYVTYYDKVHKIVSMGNQIGQTAFGGGGADAINYHKITVKRPFKKPYVMQGSSLALKDNIQSIHVAVFGFNIGWVDGNNIGTWQLGHTMWYSDS